jgi:COX assembly protein 2
MHPPLYVSKHPHCKEQIEALIKCHKDHPVAKFWGTCNEQKWALDRCFREEKKLKILENRKRKEKLEEKERLRRGEK